MITTWRYSLPSLPDRSDSWSIVFVDSTGVVAVCSDYGDWCYRWVTKHTGCNDFRDFFVGCDWDYVARKLAGGRPDFRVFDGDATRDAVRREILWRRRHRTLSAERAHDEWVLSGGIDDDGDHGFARFLSETELDGMHEYGRHTMAAGLKHWVTVSLPRLQQVIRDQLAAERPEARAD